MAANEIKLTGKEYTIAFSDQMLEYLKDHLLIGDIKNTIYSLDGIDTVLVYNDSLIVNVKDVELSPSLIFSIVLKVIGNHKLSQRTESALTIH